MRKSSPGQTSEEKRASLDWLFPSISLIDMLEQVKEVVHTCETPCFRLIKVGSPEVIDFVSVQKAANML
jgi:hypothetical protein